MVYKVKHYLAPPYMTKLLSNVSEENSYNTRAGQSGDFSVLNASPNTKKRIFLRGITSLVIFKSACAKFMNQLSL